MCYDTLGLYQIYIIPICTKCYLSITNISQYHQKEGPTENLDPPPPLKIVYIFYCGLLMALLNPCWLLTAISKGIIIAGLKP